MYYEHMDTRISSTGTVQVIALSKIDGSVAERFRRRTVPLHAD